MINKLDHEHEADPAVLDAPPVTIRDSEWRYRFLDKLGKATLQSTDADEVLTITTRMVGEQLGASNCAYADMDDDEDGFTIRGDWAREGSPSIIGHYHLRDFGQLAVTRLKAGAPLIINDNVAELAPEEAATFQGIGIAATICMPLIKDARLTALMAVHHSKPHVWTARELAVIQDVTERSWAHVQRVRAEAILRDTARALKELNDTLETKVAERSRALENSQTQFRLLVQGVTDYAIYMLDTKGSITSWNAGAERIKGYSPSEIIGSHFSTFYPETERDAGEPARALGVARTEGRFAAEGWRVRKSGERFRASVVIDAIHDDDGKLIGFAKITRDITERDENQRALEAAREALFQSQKMEAIGQLTGGVAHDFNNLLMAIMSGLRLIQKRAVPDPQVQTLIENCLSAAQRGATLTKRMLAFARRQELKVEHVNLPRLVREVVELLRRTVGPAFVINTRFPPDLPGVSADANQLEMALINLAVNARDAMPDGGQISITASAERVSDATAELPPGNYVRLTVVDTGVGMDTQTLARATEPFFTTKGVGKGTGLGLSMIHGFAHQIGGALQMESKPGAGTKVHLMLPASTAAVSDGPAAFDRSPEAPSDRRVILVVDDDAIVLLNTVELLKDLGHDVLSAPSAQAGLETVQNRPDVELIITDQAMPGMTGLQMIEKLGRIQPSLPIILATGYAELPAGTSFKGPRLAKPFDDDELRKAIDEVFGN